MKIEWQKDGGELVALVDDLGNPRKTVRLGPWGGQALVQTEPLFRSAHPFSKARGNVAGQFGFGAVISHPTIDAAVAYFAGEYLRIGEEGTLKVTVGGVIITHAGAILLGVSRGGGSEGVKLVVDYVFQIRSAALGAVPPPEP